MVNNLKKVEPTIHVSANCKRLTAYGGTKVATCGTTALTCNVQESRYTVTFEIVDGDVAPIIGCYDAIRLNLISFNQSTVHLINNNDDGTNTEFNADLVNTLSCPPPDDDNGNESDYHVKAPSQISLNKKEELRQAAASGTQLQQLETAAEDGIKLRQNKAIIPHALDSLPDKTLASMKRKRHFATDGSTNPQPQSNYGLAENAENAVEMILSVIKRNASHPEPRVPLSQTVTNTLVPGNRLKPFKWSATRLQVDLIVLELL